MKVIFKVKYVITCDIQSNICNLPQPPPSLSTSGTDGNTAVDACHVLTLLSSAAVALQAVDDHSEWHLGLLTD